MAKIIGVEPESIPRSGLEMISNGKGVTRVAKAVFRRQRGNVAGILSLRVRFGLLESANDCLSQGKAVVESRTKVAHSLGRTLLGNVHLFLGLRDQGRGGTIDKLSDIRDVLGGHGFVVGNGGDAAGDAPLVISEGARGAKRVAEYWRGENTGGAFDFLGALVLGGDLNERYGRVSHDSVRRDCGGTRSNR